MNYVELLFVNLIKSKTKRNEEVNKIATDIISGKTKMSTAQILARGGRGISRSTKKKYQRALRKVQRRIDQ